MPLSNTMSHYQQPDASGHFGIFGGSFVSETLTHAILELREVRKHYPVRGGLLGLKRAGAVRSRPDDGAGSRSACTLGSTVGSRFRSSS